MTHDTSLALECCRFEGRDCLRIRGLAEPALARLHALSDAERAPLLRVLPSESLAALQGTPAALALHELPALPGRCASEAGSLVFMPRFPLLRRTRYALLVHRSLCGHGAGAGAPAPAFAELDEYQVRHVELPDAGAQPGTRVLEIYPTCAELPLNQLRLYVHFSNPMSEGFARAQVRVLHADAERAIEDAFLDMEPELWDPGRRRLTLLFDPGRIKRGLVPHRAQGYPLREGEAVRVVVGAAFQDHAGQPLAAPFSRSYAIGPELRQRVRASDWQIEVPRAGTFEPLRLRFDRPLDHALLQHCIRVLDAQGEPLAGEPATSPGELEWRFAPRARWARGNYALKVAALLEDLAGNSLARVFDRDLARSEDAPLDLESIEQPFICGP